MHLYNCRLIVDQQTKPLIAHVFFFFSTSLWGFSLINSSLLFPHLFSAYLAHIWPALQRYFLEWITHNHRSDHQYLENSNASFWKSLCEQAAQTFCLTETINRIFKLCYHCLLAQRADAIFSVTFCSNVKLVPLRFMNSKEFRSESTGVTLSRPLMLAV